VSWHPMTWRATSARPKPEAATVAMNSLLGYFGAVAFALAAALGAVASGGCQGAGESAPVHHAPWCVAVMWPVGSSALWVEPRVVFFGVVAAVVLRAAVTDGRHAAAAPPIRTRFALAVAFLAAAAMLFVSYGSLVLGALDVSSVNAFSNLRVQGGSNHLLGGHHGLGWTGLLQRWELQAPPPHALGGGWLRVEACNSTWINAQHPGEVTSVLTPRARELLRAAGHSGRQWGAVAAAAGVASGKQPGTAAVGARAGYTGGKQSGGFTRWTVHATELRRLLQAGP